MKFFSGVAKPEPTRLGSPRAGAAVALAVTLTAATCAETEQNVAAPELAEMAMPAAPFTPERRASVTGIVEKRCVACHGCNDAPCQLKLSSPAGLLRGATKTDVYDTARLSDAPPTRLGIDGTSVQDWRGLGFHTVMPDGTHPDPRASLMSRFLALGRQANFTPGAPLPETVNLDINRPLVCPAPDEFDAYAAANPHGGMPYAMAPLPQDEYDALWSWLLAGEPLPARALAVPASIRGQVALWESFLNPADLRGRLVSRYLYEHLFLARLHFEGDAPDRFFRLVRSETPPGAAVREIATRRPLDDPGDRMYYRLVPVNETIVHKDHIVYEIGPRRMARIRQLFLQPAWDSRELPPYGVRAASNPFATFAAIPAESRYRFLLDDALYFVRSFIRGPVCHGQVATDVIEDRFWVAFLAPEWNLSVTDPSFLDDAAPFMPLPYETAESSFFERIWPVLHDRHKAWLQFRDARYAESRKHAGGLPIDAVWDGDGDNDAALLTVFRNHDNATVISGFVGDVPETAWVIDFPVFERVYYDLVAGYDVFGNVEHQLTTRLYMDHLRREGEDLFLSFLPAETRRHLHHEWYRGPLAELHASWTARRRHDTRPTAVRFTTQSPKREFLLDLADRGGRRGIDVDPRNRCVTANCAAPGTATAILSALASKRGPWVSFMPDLSMLRVIHIEKPAEVFTLFHDKAHTNVALMLGDEARREEEADVLTLVPGPVGSYPNFFFEVGVDELFAFVADVMSTRSREDWLDIVSAYGVRRTSPEIWRVADAMNAALREADPVRAGLLDLSRYRDPKAGDEPW